MAQKEEKKQVPFTEREKQLIKIINDLEAQKNELIARLKEYNMMAIFKRIEFLFKVMENRDKFPAEFVDTCREEIIAQINGTDKDEEVKEEEGKKEEKVKEE